MHNFRSGKTELVIFVTPHIVGPDSAVNKALVKKSDRMLKDFKHGLGKNLFK